MEEYLQSLIVRLYTRKCRGCADTSFHTHHLTRLGRRHYLS